jgi:hypothetical protein
MSKGNKNEDNLESPMLRVKPRVANFRDTWVNNNKDPQNVEILLKNGRKRSRKAEEFEPKNMESTNMTRHP